MSAFVAWLVRFEELTSRAANEECRTSSGSDRPRTLVPNTSTQLKRGIYVNDSGLNKGSAMDVKGMMMAGADCSDCFRIWLQKNLLLSWLPALCMDNGNKGDCLESQLWLFVLCTKIYCFVF